MIKNAKEMIEEALQDFKFSRGVERAIVRRILDRFVLYDVTLIDNETLSRLGYQEEEEEQEESGEVAYEQLTIIRRNLATGRETTITGRVKSTYVRMDTDPRQYLDAGLPPSEMYRFPISPETVTVYLSAEWVQHDSMHYLLTVLDQPKEEEEK
jgi:hypothetical protein